jgi:hypothetical protein
MRGRAISQVQIDKTLIGDASVLRDRLEVAYRFFIKANGNLLFKLGSVRVFSCSCEVVFFTHMTPFMGRTLTLEHLLYGPR